MKIISKFKDYYDYLQGVYGIDEKVVYERHMDNGYHKPNHLYLDTKNDIYKYKLAICGIIYHVFAYCEKYYFGPDGASELLEISGQSKTCNEPIHENNIPTYIRFQNGKNWWQGGETKDIHGKETNLNEKYNCPVILFRRNFDIVDRNVCLSDFGIPAIIPAHDLYVQLSTFLTMKDEIGEDHRTDIQKIQGRGFDKVKSFRKMKRNDD